MNGLVEEPFAEETRSPADYTLAELDDAIAGVTFDSEGYLIEPDRWTPALAHAIARREGLTLTARHWIVLNFARREYTQSHHDAPTLRRITHHTDVDTQELYTLFPICPAKLAARIAGLSKPHGCL